MFGTDLKVGRHNSLGCSDEWLLKFDNLGDIVILRCDDGFFCSSCCSFKDEKMVDVTTREKYPQEYYYC